MLRISVTDHANSSTMKLEGKITGPWVEELRNSWLSLAPSLGSRALCLDLCGVSFVDANGKKLLREIYQKNSARFLADTPLTQYFAETAMQRPGTSDGKGA
jgi:hypothetical protein